MREWDRHASEDVGVPERLLMDAAGRAAAEVLQREYPRGRVCVAMGGGNNGGDGAVLLRTLLEWGRDAYGIAVGEGAGHAELLHGRAAEISRGEAAQAALAPAEVIVDALLGTGVRGAPRTPQAEWIRRINARGVPVVALDGPSGVDFTTGAAPGEAVEATLTVTFGALKQGLLRFPGRRFCGRIVGVEVPFPPLPEGSEVGRLITPAWANRALPAVPGDAHKGTVGTVAVVAGGWGSAGAAVMVATAALRSGAGLVRTFSPDANRAILQIAVPEALFTSSDADDADELLAGADAVVGGPGMGTDDTARALLDRIVAASGAPLLLDADALTLLARDPDLLAAADRPLLLTPHPGEMGRMLGCDTTEVTADPLAAARRAAERWGCAVLLKGAPSLALAPGGAPWYSVSGHSGIATGGMGDTLAGVAGALLARGCEPLAAAALALFFTGRAAELAGRGRGLLPRDIAECLPAALLEDVEDGLSRLPPGVFLDLPAAR